MQNSRILGDYNVIKQIGRGPLGKVFLAEHRFMKKQFALKVFPEELAGDRAFIRRFEETVAQIAKLEHPNIVKVHNISGFNGIYFLVTDCIVDQTGETVNLAQYIMSQGRKLNENEVLHLLEQVASALDYIHSIKFGDQSIIHGSLKLNNILISKKSSGINVFLSDIGLTSIIGPGAILNRTFQAVAEALEIQSGAFSGSDETEYPNPPIQEEKLHPLHASFLQTFAFLAPEQKFVPHKLSSGHKPDVYAFGILAYYLICGKFPEGHFDLPSKCAPDFRLNWDNMIKCCLANDPETRADKLIPVLRSVSQTVSVPVLPEKKITAVSEAPASSFFQANAESIPQVLQKEKPEAAVPHATAEALLAAHKIAEPIEQLQLVEAHLQSYGEEHHSPTPAATAPPVFHDNNLQPVIGNAKIERPVTDPDPGAIFSLESTVTHYVPEEKEIKDIRPILTEMIVIKGGNFLRGSSTGNRDGMPCHQIFIDSFALDLHPVTNEQFVRFLEALGGEKDGNHNDVIRLKDSRIKRSAGKINIESGYSKHPVVGVTWYGATAYAKWIGKRLPTEAEWEVASKGGNESARYPTGDDIEKNQANFFSSDTTPVMSYAPNGYGLYDMPGNVYEWCLDWYGYNYYEASIQEPDNPQGPLQGVYRVLRGGCWKSLKDDLLCSRRHRNNPGTVNGTYGFRCAANVRPMA